MKIFIYPIVLLLSLSIVFSATGGDQAFTEIRNVGDLIESGSAAIDLEGLVGGGWVIDDSCSTAGFCGGDYEKSCSQLEDGVCPSDFGDWSLCDENNYGGLCTPCDPDCDTDGNPDTNDCGQRISLEVPNINYPAGGNIEIRASAYGYDGTGTFSILDGEGVTIANSPGVVCSQNNDYESCSHTFSVFIEDTFMEGGGACDIYTFGVNFNLNGVYVSAVYDSGMISPNIVITSPENGAEVQGTTELSSTVECSGADSITVEHRFCEIEDLNCINAYTSTGSGTHTSNFDTTEYLNGNYRFVAWAWGTKEGIVEEFADGIDVTINNTPGTGSNYEGSRILNIILARIKTWL